MNTYTRLFRSTNQRDQTKQDVVVSPEKNCDPSQQNSVRQTKGRTDKKTDYESLQMNSQSVTTNISTTHQRH